MLKTYGKIDSVISSDCEESVLYKISDGISFGLGASSGLDSKSGALADIGETILISKKFMSTRPIYPEVKVDSHNSCWSPFLVGWNNDPQLLIRLNFSEPKQFSSIITQLSDLIDSQSPIIGFYGIISCHSGSIVHKRLKKSPTAVNRGLHKAFDSEGIPFSLSQTGYEMLFAQDKIPNQTNHVVVGIVIRSSGGIWEDFGGKDVGRSVRKQAFYASPGDSSSSNELLSHTHFIVPDSSNTIALDSINGFLDLKTNISNLIGTHSPMLVSHLETSTKISDGIFAIVNLAPSQD